MRAESEGKHTNTGTEQPRLELEPHELWLWVQGQDAEISMGEPVRTVERK